MVTAELTEQTEEFLRATVPGDQSLDAAESGTLYLTLIEYDLL